MTALMCLSQPLLSKPDRNAFIEGFFNSHTESKKCENIPILLTVHVDSNTHLKLLLSV